MTLDQIHRGSQTLIPVNATGVQTVVSSCYGGVDTNVPISRSVTNYKNKDLQDNIEPSVTLQKQKNELDMRRDKRTHVSFTYISQPAFM